MKKYKMNYGLSFFMEAIFSFYTMLLVISLTIIIYSIIYRNIYILLFFCGAILCLFLVFSIISLLVDGIGKLFRKECVILNYDEIIYKNKKININCISNIDLILAEIGNRHKKGIPYGVNICYQTPEGKDYMLIYRFPIKLLKVILKRNVNIDFDKTEIKKSIKQWTRVGLIFSVLFFFCYFITEKMGCK